MKQLVIPVTEKSRREGFILGFFKSLGYFLVLIRSTNSPFSFRHSVSNIRDKLYKATFIKPACLLAKNLSENSTRLFSGLCPQTVEEVKVPSYSANTSAVYSERDKSIHE